MKKRQIGKLIPKGLLTLGIAIGLSLSAGIATAQGEIAIVANDTEVGPGEKFSAILVLNGTGRYDVYAGITGGVFGNSIFAFDDTGGLIQWVPPALPPKLMDNVNLANQATEEKIRILVPRILLDGFGGSYVLLAALSTPGQLDFPVLDDLKVDIE